jgi:hypothetical protein
VSKTEKLAHLLGSFFRNEPHKVAVWLLMPNPHFGDVPPSWLIDRDRIDKVLSFVEAAKELNTPPLLQNDPAAAAFSVWLENQTQDTFTPINAFYAGYLEGKGKGK